MRPQTSSPAVRRRSWQRGGAVLAVMAGLVVVAASTLAIRMARQVEDKTAQQQLTLQRMQRIAQALQTYWLVHSCSLPDAAQGADSTGDAFSSGTPTTVPWRTLGIAPEDAVDAWGRKISYSKNISKVNVFGADESANWALVSHGPTGLGAWLPGEQQMPAPGNADEVTNADLSALKLKQENTGQQVAPANLFDDFLLWGSLDPADCTPPETGDLIKKLLENPTAIDTKGNGSGLTSIDLVTPDLGTVRISSTGGDISTDGPYQALGVCSSGCGAGNSSNRALDSSESLSFRLGTGKTAKGFALGLLGISNTTVAVSITFKKNGVTLANLIQSVAVTTAMPLSPQLTNLALTPPGTEFDEVVVQPVGTSRFFVANVFFCQGSICPNTGDVIKKLLEDPNAIDTKVNGSGLTFIDLVTPDLGTVRISSTGGDISTDDPYKALGVCSAGCGAANSSNRALDSSESLGFRLGTNKTAKSFALGLLGISNTTVDASITIKKNGVTLANLIESVAVTTAMPGSPQLKNHALTPPGTEFDEVVVQPVGTSRFFVANVFFCQAATCPSP